MAISSSQQLEAGKFESLRKVAANPDLTPRFIGHIAMDILSDDNDAVDPVHAAYVGADWALSFSRAMESSEWPANMAPMPDFYIWLEQWVDFEMEKSNLLFPGNLSLREYLGVEKAGNE